MQVRDYLGFYDLLAFEILYPLSPRAPNLLKPPSTRSVSFLAISYHPQSGWFEDTPLKGGTEEGCPLKGVHERAHSSLRLSRLRGILPSLWSHRCIALGAFVWCGKRDSPTRRLLLPLNAGTAEPFRVSPPEAVAYPL